MLNGIRHIFTIFNLDFSLQSQIDNPKLFCHIRIISNHCANFPHLYKMKEDFVLQVVRLLLSIYSIDLLLQGHIGGLKHLLSSTNHKPSLCLILTSPSNMKEICVTSCKTQFG